MVSHAIGAWGMGRTLIQKARGEWLGRILHSNILLIPQVPFASPIGAELPKGLVNIGSHRGLAIDWHSERAYGGLLGEQVTENCHVLDWWMQL